MTKRIPVLLTILLCISADCGPAQGASAPPAAITTYRDIPGVTGEEIAAIEALKTAGYAFSYGSLHTTEAFILPDGSCAGFTAKFCELLSELFGMRFVQKIYEWDELMRKLESRALDFTGELTPTKERMQKYSMSLPIAQRRLRIFTHANADKIRTETDVKGRKIGALGGSSIVDAIRRVYPLPFEHRDVDNFQTAALLIWYGEIDAFVGEAVADPAFEEYSFIRSAIFFPMVHKSVSMTTANPELAPVISVVSKYIAAGGIDRLYEIYMREESEYAKHKLHSAFTSEERAYLEDLRQRGASVGVAFERDMYPVSFYNLEEGEFQGIAADVLTAISKLTGIRFEAATEKDAPWQDIFDKAQAGEVPMVARLPRSEAGREHFQRSAFPYAGSYYAIMSRSEHPDLAPYQIARTPVGVMRQSGYKDVYRELFPDNDNLEECGSQDECLDALERGDIKLLMASEYALLTQTHYREKPGFKINISLTAPMDSYFGFHKNEETLRSVIDKAQQYVHTSAIETRWTRRIFDYSKKLAENLAVFAGALAVMLIMTALSLAKNVLLGRKLKEMANHDALTGIHNRRHFMELCRMLLARSSRAGGECFIVIFDLDYFKDVNDTHGHQAGDKVLKEAARRVKRAIRPYDVFGRYGGEEFILCMPDIDKTNVMQVAERIRRDLCSWPVDFEDRAIPVSASFGVARVAPVNDVEAAIRCADEALYQAKRQGRNRVVFYRQGR